jgi:hypothetical protein
VGAAAPIAATMLAALAALPAGMDGLWPRWISQLGAVAALVYLLRTGTLFTAEGVFAADGLLGLYVPVAALLGWTLVASIALARDVG